MTRECLEFWHRVKLPWPYMVEGTCGFEAQFCLLEWDSGVLLFCRISFQYLVGYPLSWYSVHFINASMLLSRIYLYLCVFIFCVCSLASSLPSLCFCVVGTTFLPFWSIYSYFSCTYLVWIFQSWTGSVWKQTNIWLRRRKWKELNVVISIVSNI